MLAVETETSVAVFVELNERNRRIVLVVRADIEVIELALFGELQQVIAE